MAHINLYRSGSTGPAVRVMRVALSILIDVVIVVLAVILTGHVTPAIIRAEPLPGGWPKLSLSTHAVTPTIAAPGDITLTYNIRLLNTGAWTTTAASVVDVLPTATTYISGSLQASSGEAVVNNNVLTWTGVIGFDSSAEITFSARLSPVFTSGQVINSAVVSDVLLTTPLTLTAITTVTHYPILSIAKTSAPRLPGANQPLAYTITVANNGQAAFDLPITVTDRVPLSVNLRAMGTGGVTSPISDVITWTRQITLGLGETTAFTFSVEVGHVPSGTVIANTDYRVAYPSGIAVGQAHTSTVVASILSLSKITWPDPPGSNREMTYTLELLNRGSLATNLIVTDRVPPGVTYVRGGAPSGGVVSWSLPKLDTNESAEFTYTVYVSDVMNVPIVNNDYHACSAEGVCQPGVVLTSVVSGPRFYATAALDPIAKKPGGGGGPVTPTLVVRNVGAGNALNARATLFFERISVSANDLYAIPATGTPPPFPNGPGCDNNCVSYSWIGSIGHGEAVTFTTLTGQSTIGGEEGTIYSTTVVVTDGLSNINTYPVTGTAIGKVTHFASPAPDKSVPAVIGRGQLLTYTITVLNSGLSTDLPPILTDTVPASATFVSASEGGVTQTINVSNALPTTVVSWTLPTLGPGALAVRSFSVRVANDLVSGTQIVNRDYAVFGYGNVLTNAIINGPPVTTTVREVGLIDSFKEVTPVISWPGPNQALTYCLHIVNSSPLSLTGVTVSDVLPWQASTYRRDAVASAGQVVSDIVTLRWTGEVGPMSSQVITFSVAADPYYTGMITNTAVISHPDLLAPVSVQAVAYMTDQPLLFIDKSASPNPVRRGSTLAYTLHVVNQGQPAFGLVITDVTPANTRYVTNSATANGQLIADRVRWVIPVLESGESQEVGFQVIVAGGMKIYNDQYAVTSLDGATALGAPVITVVEGSSQVYLPLVLKTAY